MTDPYVVRCPVCLAEPGERCANHIRPLESVHWSRQRLARRRRAEHAGRRQLADAVRGARGRSG